MHVLLATGPADDGDGDLLPDPDDAFDTSGVADLIADGFEAFFHKLVENALNPMLDLLGQTLLTTPLPDEVPKIGALWEQSRQFSVASFVLLVMIAGIVVMGYESVQTRHSVKEILPRLVLAFLGANLSLLLARKAVLFANAASAAVLGKGLDPDQAASALSDLVLGSLQNHGVFLLLIGFAITVMLIVLLVTYVVRVALTLILIAAAPLAIMCYALPQTEAVARWWWRAFAGVLTIQLAQSLTLVVFLRVFFDGDNFTLFGGVTASGMVNLLMALALFYLLVKIPFWIGAQVRAGTGRSMVGNLIRGFIAYKTLGALKGATAAKATAGGTPRAPGSGGHTGRRRPPGSPGDPGTGRPGTPSPSHSPKHPNSPHAQRRVEANQVRRMRHHDLASRAVPSHENQERRRGQDRQRRDVPVKPGARHRQHRVHSDSAGRGRRVDDSARDQQQRRARPTREQQNERRSRSPLTRQHRPAQVVPSRAQHNGGGIRVDVTERAPGGPSTHPHEAQIPSHAETRDSSEVNHREAQTGTRRDWRDEPQPQPAPRRDYTTSEHRSTRDRSADQLRSSPGPRRHSPDRPLPDDPTQQPRSTAVGRAAGPSVSRQSVRGLVVPRVSHVQMHRGSPERHAHNDGMRGVHHQPRPVDLSPPNRDAAAPRPSTVQVKPPPSPASSAPGRARRRSRRPVDLRPTGPPHGHASGPPPAQTYHPPSRRSDYSQGRRSDSRRHS